MQASKSIIFLITLMAALVSFPQELRSQSTSHLQTENDPVDIGNRVVANIVKHSFGWRYMNACTYYGALIFADASGSSSISRQMEEGYEPYMKGKRSFVF